MRRQLLSSLVGCRLTSSAALLLVGHNLFLHYHSSSNHYYGRRSDDAMVPPSFRGMRGRVTLCEGRFSSPFSNGSDQRETVVQKNENIRTCRTRADLYFADNERLPLPQVMHKVLTKEDEYCEDPSVKPKGVLVVGDVHGCFEELELLHQAAVKANDNTPFRFVVLVGDLCNKGPHSARVIRFVRKQKNWFTVRGNHDDATLAAALGHVWRRKHEKYNWVMEGENSEVPPDKVSLSDDDVMWLSELPYTITIPASLFGEEEDLDTVIVHAGFVPGIAVEGQEIADMIQMREVVEVYSSFDGVDPATGKRPIRYAHYRTRKPAKNPIPRAPSLGEPLPLPWAGVWKGPQRVIFGHDAKRGFQRYDGDWAIGLDTGAVYGKQLTGIILPEKQIVSVDAVAEHCQVDKAKKVDSKRTP